MKNLTDNEIIDSVISGNQGDFALLVDRYKDRAFSMLKRMLQNEMDAEEVLQDSFLKAYGSLKNFRKEAKFSTWFYKIVYNAALSALSNTKRKLEKKMTSIEDHLDLGDYDARIYSETNDASEYIIKMVNKLPVKYGLVLILFYIDDMSLNEISQVMDLSIVNVKVILHRSRNALRKLLISHNYQEALS